MNRVLVLLGAPGVGKGTYGKLLEKSFEVPLLTLSNTFRSLVSQNSDKHLINELEQCLRNGRLVPDSLTVEIIGKELELEKYRQGYILDGFPRTATQAKALENDLGQVVDLVVHLQLSKEEYLIQKLLGRRICSRNDCTKAYNIAHVENNQEGVFMPALLPQNGSESYCDCGASLISREDDTKKIISERLQVYNREIKPVIDFYDSKENDCLLNFMILRGLDDLPNLKNTIKNRLKLGN